MGKRLYRSKNDRLIWGVCGGLAQYFDIDATIVRIVAVLLLFAGIGIPAYIVLAIVIPSEESRATEPKEAIKENVEELKENASALGEEIRSTFEKNEEETPEVAQLRNRRRSFFGAIIIIIGAIFLLNTFTNFWWFRWTTLWPLILIAVGILVIVSTRKRS
ncbi:PspC domain-containing protein [Chloroflexota bacterium]